MFAFSAFSIIPLFYVSFYFYYFASYVIFAHFGIYVAGSHLLWHEKGVKMLRPQQMSFGPINWLMITLDTGGEVENDARFEITSAHSEREN